MMKKVALINDLSGFGRCSLTAAMPIISALGISCNPVATAILTGQSGYEHYYCQDMTEMLSLYVDAWKKNEVSFDGIYSGYVTGPKQIDYINVFLDEFLGEDTFYLLDPVMGDDGEGYSIYSEELLLKMRKLIKRASVITPNLTELCMIADEGYEAIEAIEGKSEKMAAIEKVAEKVKAKSGRNLEIIVTGIRISEDKEYIYNMVFSEEETFVTSSPAYTNGFSGTGDLFASVVCGLKMRGISTKNAAKVATEFIYRSIQDTIGDNLPGTDGINFENNILWLIQEALNEK